MCFWFCRYTYCIKQKGRLTLPTVFFKDIKTICFCLKKTSCQGGPRVPGTQGHAGGRTTRDNTHTDTNPLYTHIDAINTQYIRTHTHVYILTHIHLTHTSPHARPHSQPHCDCSPQRMPWQALMPRPLMSFHQNNSAVDILVKIVGRGLFGRIRQGGNKVPSAPQPAPALHATLLLPRPTPTEGEGP